MKRSDSTSITKIANVSDSKNVQITIVPTATDLKYKKVLSPRETSVFTPETGSAYLIVEDPSSNTIYWEGNIPWKVNGTISIYPDNKQVSYEGYTIPSRKKGFMRCLNSRKTLYILATILLIILVILFMRWRSRRR